MRKGTSRHRSRIAFSAKCGCRVAIMSSRCAETNRSALIKAFSWKEKSYRQVFDETLAFQHKTDRNGGILDLAT